MNISYAAMTYYPNTDTLEVMAGLSESPTGQYLGFWGGEPAGQWPPDTGFSIVTADLPSDTLYITKVDYDPFSFQLIGTTTYTLDASGQEIFFSVPFSQLELGSNEFEFEVSTATDTLIGVSSIGSPVIHTPEPSASLLILPILFFFSWRFLWQHLMNKICWPAWTPRIGKTASYGRP